MALTDPTGDPTILQAIIANEHATVDQVLTEAMKVTATPGVHEQLLDHLVALVRTHVHAGRSVLDDEVRDALGAERAEALEHDETTLHQLVTTRPTGNELDELAASWSRHVDLHDTILASLRRQVGGRRMAALGWSYQRVAEHGPPPG